MWLHEGELCLHYVGEQALIDWPQYGHADMEKTTTFMKDFGECSL